MRNHETVSVGIGHRRRRSGKLASGRKNPTEACSSQRKLVSDMQDRINRSQPLYFHAQYQGKKAVFERLRCIRFAVESQYTKSSARLREVRECASLRQTIAKKESIKMNPEIMSSLQSLITQDRSELRSDRDKISNYSVTLLSAILAVFASSRSDKPILSEEQAIYLNIGLLVIYLCVAVFQYIGLHNTRKNLMRRETLLIGSDDPNSSEYSRERIQLLYDNPTEYTASKHLKQKGGDTQYLGMIVAVAVISIILIVVSYITY
jgi:hypothetical protein